MKFIQDGRRRLLKDPDTIRQLAEKTEEIQNHYQDKLDSAGFFKRITLRLQMQKEIRKAEEKIAPSAGCYLKS